MDEPWHARAVAEVAARFGTDVEAGLSPERLPPRPELQVASRARGPWRILVAQVKGGVVLVLLGATGVMLALGHLGDAAAIFASVVFSVVFGFATELRAEGALEALRSLTAPTARVVRGGQEREVPLAEVRAGDLLVLSAGQIVAADGRIASVRDLQIDESALTGESAPVLKSLAAVGEGAPLPERVDMAYAGTTVVGGFGHLVVTAAGRDTELGRIGRLVAEAPREVTPLEAKAEQLGRQLALLAVGLSALVTGLGLLRHLPWWLMLETGVLLAIAAIPEGLPAVTTVALAAGVRRMARKHCLVRRLASVETLGSTTVICTDKTGTLTENVMRATRVELPGASLEVTGAGYAPEGEFSRDGVPVDPARLPGLLRLLQAAAVCNDAKLESHGGWHVHGSSTEGALATLARKAGVDGAGHERLRIGGFSSARKRMSVVARTPRGEVRVFVKGSPEVLAPLCSHVLEQAAEVPLDAARRAELRAAAAALGRGGYRVLALADRAGGDPSGDEEDLVWLGLVGLIDPPRAGVREAVAQLGAAGIRTVMVTGDQKDTAFAIARELGIAGDDALCLDSQELAAYARDRRFDDLRRTAVFARVSPEDKLTVVRALREAGHVVAMTGDGINDAPALRAADIGIAIGRGAADVAREAADLVVTDGDYATLPVAVAEGRRIYANLRRSVHFLLLCSLSTIGVMLLALVAALPLPMTPLQILWLNLVVHVFPAVGLVLTPGDPDVLRRPPRDPRERLLTWGAVGTVSLGAALVAGAVVWGHAGARAGGPHGQALVMANLALILLFQTLPLLSERPVWTAGAAFRVPLAVALAGSLALQAIALYLPALAAVLETAPLQPSDLLRALGLSVGAVLVVEAGKAARRTV